jgi:antitoxin component of MazEF toxin-antitoxin module
MTNKITITKKVAKQGNTLLIVIPSCLKEFVKKGDVVKVDIQKIDLGGKNE